MQIWPAIDLLGGKCVRLQQGDYARETIDALRRIGSEDRAALLEKSIKAFGPAGPSQDRDERNTQQEKMSEEQSESLGALDTAWYDLPRELDTEIYLYCLKKKHDFAGSR